jgi:hypothetical protein
MLDRKPNGLLMLLVGMVGIGICLLLLMIPTTIAAFTGLK